MKDKYKFLLINLVIILKCSVFDSKAQIITIKHGVPIGVDGVVNASEWLDADSILISVGISRDVTVKFKHDGANFNFAFINNLESMNIRFPEVLMDIENDKSPTWLMDDWWFHVSATDCSSNSAANDYSNCLLVQPDWTAVNNFTGGPPSTDTVEIQIPFTKVNFNSMTTDTIGLAFDVTNTASVWNYWPDNSVNSQNPSSWGNAIVEFGTTGIKSAIDNDNSYIVYPNPVLDQLNIQFEKPISGSLLINIYDLQGKLVFSTFSKDLVMQTILNMSDINFDSGIYTLEMLSIEFSQIMKMVKL